MKASFFPLTSRCQDSAGRQEAKGGECSAWMDDGNCIEFVAMNALVARPTVRRQFIIILWRPRSQPADGTRRNGGAALGEPGGGTF